jgi:hypothetical protein
VVRHEAVAISPPAAPPSEHVKASKKLEVIFDIAEDVLPSIPTRRDVEDAAGKLNAGRSGHEIEPRPCRTELVGFPQT